MKVLKKFVSFFVSENTIRFSKIYQYYLKNFKRKAFFQGLTEEFEFQKQLFGNNNALIFDVGANEGYKTELFLGISKRVVSVDPDNKNFGVLTHRYGKNPRVSIEKKAVSDTIGTAEFLIESEGSPVNTLSKKWTEILTDEKNPHWASKNSFSKKIEVETTTLDALIAKHGTPDLIKIDVEGYEVNVIKGLSKKVPLIVFEANLPDFLSETVECVERLSQISPAAGFNACRSGAYVFDRFVPVGEFVEYLNTLPVCTVEVFSKAE